VLSNRIQQSLVTYVTKLCILNGFKSYSLVTKYKMIQYGDDTEITLFEQAAKDVHRLPQRPTNDELLFLYGLYKQATSGNINTSSPGLLDFKAKAKWNAWNAQRGKGTSRARTEYITLVRSFQDKYSNSL
jgi:diazepam-binding inhibitor (GABA receptor modulating acyl-CoA-binding protein)